MTKGEMRDEERVHYHFVITISWANLTASISAYSFQSLLFWDRRSLYKFLYYRTLESGVATLFGTCTIHPSIQYNILTSLRYLVPFILL